MTSKKRVARVRPKKSSWTVELPEEWDTMTGGERQAYIWDSSVDDGLFGGFVSEEIGETAKGVSDETTPVIVGWAVGDLHGAPAMYNINEFDRASDAARRWGKPITGLVQAPNTPTFAPRPYSSEETCGKPFGDDVREYRCTEPAGHSGPCKQSPLKASEPRELTASEAASFSKTLARSPRVLEKAGARPTPQQLGERHADTLRALAEDVCKCRGKLGWTRDESGTVICPHCRLPITHPENGEAKHG
jgi:hypothetical protein